MSDVSLQEDFIATCSRNIILPVNISANNWCYSNIRSVYIAHRKYVDRNSRTQFPNFMRYYYFVTSKEGILLKNISDLSCAPSSFVVTDDVKRRTRDVRPT